jgi:hypothetical protein
MVRYDAEIAAGRAHQSSLSLQGAEADAPRTRFLPAKLERQLGKLPCCERFPWVSGPNQSLRAHHPHQEVQGHKNTHQGFWHDR